MRELGREKDFVDDIFARAKNEKISAFELFESLVVLIESLNFGDSQVRLVNYIIEKKRAVNSDRSIFCCGERWCDGYGCFLNEYSEEFLEIFEFWMNRPSFISGQVLSYLRDSELARCGKVIVFGMAVFLAWFSRDGKFFSYGEF